MALSADDRLLGEKVHYYCSSSEDEGENEEGEGGGSLVDVKTSAAKFIPEAQVKDYTSNTGPKGVIEDWRRFKQLETEKKDEQELERMNLAKKLSLTCRSNREDEEEKQKDAALMKQLEEQFEDMEEEFLKEYRQKRLEDIRRTLETAPTFGKIINLTRETFVDAVDKENHLVPVIIHIYEKGAPGCDTMNHCLDVLATEHLSAKFCRIRASQVQMSLNFSISGLPALLVYRNGELIGNFLRLADEFGSDFQPGDVEGFLIENGMLPDEPTKSKGVIRNSAAHPDSDSD